MRILKMVLLCVFLWSYSYGEDSNSIKLLTAICDNHQLMDIYTVKKLNFTFNVQLPDKIVKRKWEWHVKTNKIYLNGESHELSQKFINDVYWLLFPLKVYESKDDVAFSINKTSRHPITGESCTELTVQYTDGEGFTPNDIYKLYVNDKDQITGWSYLKGGKEPAARVTTWEDYKEINGITLSLLRKSSSDFKVWFTDVSLEK